MPRVRAVAVAIGVPAAFVLVSVLLGLGSPGPRSVAAEPSVRPSAAPADPAAPAEPTTPAAPGSGPASPPAPFGVRRQPARIAPPPVDIAFRVDTSDPVVFLTVDDGVHKDRRALRYVEARSLPVTAFLSTWTIKGDAAYFARIARWGSIQNHSATHASMAEDATDLDHEICYPQRLLTRDFGTEPWLLRPPYGAGYDRVGVRLMSARCGIRDIVLWDAVVEKGKVIHQREALRPGAIVLLHFTRHLDRDLRAAVRAARQAGLTPASLADYLPAPLR